AGFDWRTAERCDDCRECVAIGNVGHGICSRLLDAVDSDSITRARQIDAADLCGGLTQCPRANQTLRMLTRWAGLIHSATRLTSRQQRGCDPTSNQTPVNANRKIQKVASRAMTMLQKVG